VTTLDAACLMGCIAPTGLLCCLASDTTACIEGLLKLPLAQLDAKNINVCTATMRLLWKTLEAAPGLLLLSDLNAPCSV